MKSALNYLSTVHSNVSEELSRFTLDIAHAKSENEIFAMLAERLPRMLPADRCSVALLHENSKDAEIYALSGTQGALAVGAIIPLESSFIGQALRDKKTYSHSHFEASKLDDARLLHKHGIKSCINSPIHFSDRIVGTVNVGSTEANIYGHNSVDLLKLVTSIVSTYLERQQLLEQANNSVGQYKCYTSQLEELAKVAEKLSSAGSEEDIFSVITGSAQKITSADRISFIVPIEGKNEFAIKRILSHSDAFISQANILMTGTSVELVLKSGDSHFFDHIADTDYTDHRLLSNLGLNTAWSVPVKVKGKVIGLLNAASVEHIADGTQHLRILNMLAGIMSATLGRVELQAQLEFQASYDSLTGLPNRNKLNEVMQSAISDESNKPFTVLFIDLDRFKAVNDSLGHDIGDQVLRIVTDRIKQQVGENDCVTRHGGDEFVVLLMNTVNSDQADRIADNITQAIKAPIEIDTQTIFIGSSIGLSQYPSQSQAADELLKFADIAMYYAKQKGENKIKWYSKELLKEVGLKQRIDNDLRCAAKKGEFYLVYQPLFTLDKVTGVEVLLRWQHSELGEISPSVFCPIAEENGFIQDITLWVLQNSLAFIKKLHQTNPSIYVSVNVSAKDCLNANRLQTTILDLLKKHDLPGSVLELEVTENIYLQDLEQTKVLFDNLKSHGVRFAIDDFGTGFSSLTYLLSLPFNTLKIDQSFICNIDKKRTQKGIVKGIIDVANSLSMSCIAEGVETEQQQDCLKELGCQRFQGYLLSKPLVGDSLIKFLQEHE